MSVIEQPKSYLQAVMQGLQVPEVLPEAPEVPNFQQERTEVLLPQVTVVKPPWDLLLESKSSNEKIKINKKEKKEVRLSLKAPAEKDCTNNANNKREPRNKRPAAGKECLSSKADCKGVSSSSYRCISCKARYV